MRNGVSTPTAGQAWYRDYLTSPAWLRTRDAKVAAVGERCERCPTYGKRGPDGLVLGLHVHHLTYDRCPGNELLEDLEVLCVVCHAAEHGVAEDTVEARERATVALSRRMAAVVMAPLVADALEEDWDAA